jgi:hypothetical protein
MRRLVLVALLCATAAGCRRHAATADDCRLILARIVELELRELGFRDAALADRKRTELRRTLGAELSRCEGVRVRAGAMDCVRQATTVEEISHRCLR